MATALQIQADLHKAIQEGGDVHSLQQKFDEAQKREQAKINKDRQDVIQHAKGLGIADVYDTPFTYGADQHQQNVEWDKFTKRLNETKAKQRTGAVGTTGTEKGLKKFVSTDQQKAASKAFYSSPEGVSYAEQIGKPAGFGQGTISTGAGATLGGLISGANIGGREGLFGGDPGSFLNQKGNYYETTAPRGNFVTYGGGTRTGSNIDPNGPGFEYWYKNQPELLARYASLTTEEKKAEDVRANIAANRPKGAQGFKDFQSKTDGDYNAYLAYLKDYDPEVSKGVVYDSSEGHGDQSSSSVYVAPGVQPMNMAELTDDMILSNRLREVINQNSPLFKAAQTKALQAMNARGIVNSSMATEAVMNAMLSVALPIAQAEVNALQTNLYYNTDWNNQQIAAANDYYYKSMLTKMGKQMDYQLQYMTQSFGAWGKYGDWISRLGTTPGMDAGAVDWTMGALPQLPEWFYNWK